MSLLQVTRDGSVAILELQNGKVNALSSALMQEMATTLSSLSSDSDVGAIIIRGSNKAFSGAPYVYIRGSYHMLMSTLFSWRRHQRVEIPRLHSRIFGRFPPSVCGDDTEFARACHCRRQWVCRACSNAIRILSLRLIETVIAGRRLRTCHAVRHHLRG